MTSVTQAEEQLRASGLPHSSPALGCAAEIWGLVQQNAEAYT